jgi:cobalt-zinc-cadmium efflux system membrane fusion protein
MTPVQKGNSENGRTEILNPTELPSQKIVTKGAYTLLMAMKNKEE